MTTIQIISIIYSICALLSGCILWYEIPHAIKLKNNDPFFNDEIKDEQ